MGARSAESAQSVGRYTVYGEIASGGMATVHFGRLVGPAGFSRTVAIKRLFPQFGRDPEFVSMLLDEARLAARVRHPNVVQTLDVVADPGELCIVMEFIQGESLARLLREAGKPAPPAVVCAIMAGALHGLHAAHEATDEQGAPLEIIHRDVSPHNILVGADGVARVLDFGVAKALGRLHTTRDGRVKGKLAYMAPEQLKGAPISRKADIFAAATVLWQALAGRRLFDAETEALIVAKVLEEPIAAPSRFAPGVRRELDDVTLRGLARDPGRCFASAEEMALALEAAERPALASEVSAWVKSLAGDALAFRASEVARIESGPVAPLPQLPPSGRTQATPSGRADASQVSSLSVSSGAPSHVRAKSRGTLALVAAAVLAVVVGATFSLSRIRQSRSPAPVTQSGAGAPGSTSSNTPPPPTAEVPLPSATPESPAVASAPRPTSSARPAPARAPHSPKSNCYRIDSDGIWHIKPSCL